MPVPGLVTGEVREGTRGEGRVVVELPNGVTVYPARFEGTGGGRCGPRAVGATPVLTQQLARAPTPAELAPHLHVSEEQITQAQYASQAYHAVSLDAPVTDKDGAASLGDLAGQDDPALEHVIDIESVHAYWAELNDQAQRLLTLRFYGNLTQEQIGKQVGVSQMQVSRLLRRALDYLRACLTAVPVPDPQRR